MTPPWTISKQVTCYSQSKCSVAKQSLVVGVKGSGSIEKSSELWLQEKDATCGLLGFEHDTLTDLLGQTLKNTLTELQLDYLHLQVVGRAFDYSGFSSRQSRQFLV